MFKLFKPAAPPPRRPSAARPAQAEGAALRSAPSEADQRLSAMALGWLQALPADVRPAALGERFARIANRLALVWPDAELTDRYFESLIIDRRGGRKGFPPEVMAELIRLRAHRISDQRAVQPAVALAMKAIDFDPS